MTKMYPAFKKYGNQLNPQRIVLLSTAYRLAGSTLSDRVIPVRTGTGRRAGLTFASTSIT